jgi:hypothetical protein
MRKLIAERLREAQLFLEGKEVMQLEMGTDEYSKVIEKIVAELQQVKSSLKTRSREGLAHRKEADRIQSAINAMKYLSNKSRRMINSSVIKEEIEKEEIFDRETIKNFIKSFR